MDGFGDLLGGLGDLLGAMLGDGAEEAGAAAGMGALFGAGAGGRRNESQAPLPYAAYERYLCGGPRNLNINDR
jgi:hypothetical protein